MLPTAIQAFVDHQIESSPHDFTGIRAVVFNGTLKRSPERSHTEGLASIAVDVMRKLGARVDVVRTIDHHIAPGVYPDMREHGWPLDDFPALFDELVRPAHILVLASPTWLGDQSSQTRLIIERLYGCSGMTNDAGQWLFYGKVGGAVVTGNEDGGKHIAAQLLYALQHLGCTIPPQADTYWNGPAGPGPSYLDEPGGGRGNIWTIRNTVFLAWNLLHTAHRLRDAGGLPAYGNRTDEWDLSTPTHPNPEYR